MKLVKPVYKFIPKEERILEFKGYNKKSVISDGEMREMYNLSSDEYPCLYQRKPRGIYLENFRHPTAMIVKNKKLAVISEGKFCYDGMIYPSLKLSDKTQMVVINTKICFFPEKKFFDTVIETVGSLSAEVEVSEESVTLTTSTIKFSNAYGLENEFVIGDAIQITSEDTPEINVSAVIKEIASNSIVFPDETFISVIADGEEEKTVAVQSAKIERSCPDLDYVMENGNRLWGVSNKDNTIYACKLGDPTNWTYFQNTSLDSYYAQQGTDGEWTGCAAYRSNLLFFKEDYIHKLYGSQPSSYQITASQCHALEKGSSKSIAIINETVLYKSRLGIMAYAGGAPMLISENFGTERFSDVVSGTDGIKYYASVLRDGKPELLVYDMEKLLWHKEDDVRARDFCYHNGKLLYINDADNIIYEMASNNPLSTEKDIRWVAQLGPFDEFVEDKKVYSKLKMRIDLADLSELEISISMDDGTWEKIQYINAEHDRSLFIPIIPRRCDRFAVRLVGKGYCKISSLVREYRQGSHGKGVS